MSTARITLEIAVQGLADALAAYRGGADRLEVCSALELHGLTPSSGLLRQLGEVPLPKMVMIRPRAGGFCYREQEIQQMRLEIAEAIACGADGLVFGCLTPDGAIDAAACRQLLAACRGRPAVFHRAFDLVPDQEQALLQLRTLGIARVLTSGGQAVAASERGRSQISHLIRAAGGTIEILPGGGIRGDNVARLLAETKCRQVHAACRSEVGSGSDAVNFETVFTSRQPVGGTQEGLVRALRAVLDARS